MATHVALLRGVNVGGRSLVPMAGLREVFESLGHRDVRTYIQSGNVIFSAGARVPARPIEDAIRERFGVETVVVLRTAGELARVVAANPFPHARPSGLHVGFCAARPAAAAVAGLDAARFAPDEVVVSGREVYYHLPGGLGRSRLVAHVDRRLGVPETRRNWRTVTALVERAGG